MKFLILFLLLFAANPSLPAQTTGIDQSSDLLTVPDGDKFLRWYGHTGRSYFVQISDANNPLAKWFWVPIIEAGNNDEISYEVDGTASKSFFRLKYTDQTVPEDKTLDTADFDGDGISNTDEIDPPSPLLASDATDPLDPDTDHDGLPDGFERTHGLNPNDDGTTDPDNGSAGDLDGDGLSNATELALGTDPSKLDSDGDGISDWDEVMVNFTNPLTATDADSDGLADDWEKWWATQIIASGVAVSTSQQTALSNGNVEPGDKPFNDGTSNKEQFDVSKEIAAVGESISPYRIHRKERAVWGTLWAHEDGNCCGISGLANGDVRWRGYPWESTCPPAGWVSPSASEIDQELTSRAPWDSVEWQDFPLMETEAKLQQDTSDDGYTYTEFKEFNHVFKLIYPAISNESRTANFLKVTTTWGYPIAGVDPPQTVERVQLTVPTNRTTSQEVEIKPTLALGAEKNVYLHRADLVLAIPKPADAEIPPILAASGVSTVGFQSSQAPAAGETTADIDFSTAPKTQIPEDKEDTEGAWAVLNFDDDDNDSGAAVRGQLDIKGDWEDQNEVAGENDLIYLAIRKIDLPGVKFRLKYNNDQIRIYKKLKKSEPVVSEVTELTPDEKDYLTVFVEGIKPHENDEGTIVTQQIKIGTGPWLDGDTAKVRVACPVVVCYGEGANEWSNQESDPKLFDYLKETAEIGKNPSRLRKLSNDATFKQETCMVPGKSQSGMDVCYSVSIMGSNKAYTEKIARLSLQNSYTNVVFAGHANWGIGMAFGKNFDDFGNFFWTSSGGKPALNITGFHEHAQISPMLEIGGLPFPNSDTVFALWNSMAVTQPHNRFLEGPGILQGVERYPNVLSATLPSVTRLVPPINNAPAPADDTIFDVHHELRTRSDLSTSQSIYHYVADPNEDGDAVNGHAFDQRVIVQRPCATDVPALHYQSLFMNQCNSYRYFIESFRQGVVISTWQNIFVSSHTQPYVGALIEGKQWGEIESLLQTIEPSTGTGTASRRGLIEISSFPAP